MSVFGFTFKALYRLEVDELWDIARLIKGENHYLPKNKDVLYVRPYRLDSCRCRYCCWWYRFFEPII